MIDFTILSNLALNEPFGRKVLPFLKEDYFNNEDKVLFNLTKSFIDKYNSFPTKEALFIDLNNLKINETQHKSVQEKIQQLTIDENTDMQWLLDQTETFCRRKAIHNGILQSISILDGKGNLDEGSIPKILQDALAVSFDTNIGLDILDDWEKWLENSKKTEKKIPFDIEYLNKATNGGTPRKTFNVLISGTGGGKTLSMCHMAAANLAMGYNVLYITLEMAEDKIADRIYSNLLDIGLDELATYPKDVYEKKIDRLQSKTKGKLKIKEYPTASAGANHFRFLLNELRLKKNFVPDVIYIDYVNLCVSSRLKFTGNVNSYSYVKAVSEELRGLFVEFNCAGWTATQLNRTGYADSDADLTHTSDSFGLPMTADFMIAIISTEQLEGLNQYLFKQLKNRYTDPSINRKFVIGVDKRKMRLYDVEQDAQNVTDGPVMDNTDFVRKEKFDTSKFKDFK